MRLFLPLEGRVKDSVGVVGYDLEIFSSASSGAVIGGCNNGPGRFIYNVGSLFRVREVTLEDSSSCKLKPTASEVCHLGNRANSIISSCRNKADSFLYLQSEKHGMSLTMGRQKVPA
jgi:hypothetical protein